MLQSMHLLKVVPGHACAMPLHSAATAAINQQPTEHRLTNEMPRLRGLKVRRRSVAIERQPVHKIVSNFQRETVETCSFGCDIYFTFALSEALLYFQVVPTLILL